MRAHLLVALAAPGAGHWRTGHRVWAVVFASGAVLGIVAALLALLPVLREGVALGQAVIDFGARSEQTAGAVDELLAPLLVLAGVLLVITMWHGASFAHLWMLTRHERPDATSRTG